MARRLLTKSQLLEFKKCKADVVYMIKKYGRLKHTSRGEISWRKPYPYQVQLWEELQAGRDIIVNKTRQIGVSWAVAAFAIWKMIFHPDVEILFLSETEKKAIRILNNAKFFFYHLPAFLRPSVSGDSQTRFEVKFAARRKSGFVVKKSSIDSLTTTGRSGASYSAILVLMDEAAHLSNPETTWEGVRPSAAHGGQIVVVSTPNKTNNLFFRLWSEATDPLVESSMVPIVAYWRDCWLSEAWYERATSGLTDTQILQEFELKFLSAGSPFFDVIALAACYKPKEAGHKLLDHAGHRIDQRTAMSFTGVDTAEGKRLKSGVPDYTSIITLNEFGVEIMTWHSNKTKIEDVAGYTMTLPNGQVIDVEGIVSKRHRLYPGAMVIERWGNGDAVYIRHCFKVPDDEVSFVIGRKMTGGQRGVGSKQRLLNSLRLAVAGRQVVIRDSFTYKCFQAFEDKGQGKYGAALGFFDDPVIAFALGYSELWKHGGYQLELPDELAGGRRMVAAQSAGDADPSDVGHILPVGTVIQGPVLGMDGGDSWRETDVWDMRKTRL